MGNKEQFIADLYPAARRVSQETGMSWELILAQAALETGWGERVLPGTNNIFNIKADAGWDGPRRTFNVREYVDGRWVNLDQDFRVYGSTEEALRDRVDFLRENPRYARAGLFDEGVKGNLEREADALQRAGYATDPQYARQLSAVFNGPTMQRGIRLAQGQAQEGDAPQPQADGADRSGSELYTEIGRRITAQTGWNPGHDVVTNVTRQAMEAGISSIDKLGRVDVEGGQVFLRGANGIDRIRVDLSAPGADARGAGDASADDAQSSEDVSPPRRILK